MLPTCAYCNLEQSSGTFKPQGLKASTSTDFSFNFFTDTINHHIDPQQYMTRVCTSIEVGSLYQNDIVTSKIPMSLEIFVWQIILITSGNSSSTLLENAWCIRSKTRFQPSVCPLLQELGRRTVYHCNLIVFVPYHDGGCIRYRCILCFNILFCW